ncbi:MAG TPA: beta-lactamase family protein [Chloroflexi bacterium]|nr:beta-lactamase family protein [Chloroflexota bacterium]
MRVSAPTSVTSEVIEQIEAAAPAIAVQAADFAARHRLPSLTYGVITAGRLVISGGVGQAELASGMCADAATRYRIASMTKSFAAVAVLQLRDAGLLSLDDPVARYLPEMATLAYPTRDSPTLTLRHLLTMAPGWPEDNPWGDRQLSLDDAAFTALLAEGVTFAAAPDTQYEYSNLGYMILGRVVARVAGTPFQHYVNTRILAPLGMTASGWNPEDAPVQQLAHGYRLVDGHHVEDALAFARSAGDAAAFGGLYASVEDLARWVAFFLDAWPARDGEEGTVLRRSSRREMQRCANLRLPIMNGQRIGAPVRYEAGGYGYGLFSWLSTDLGRIVGHAGGLPGFGSHMLWLPDHDLGVVALANLTYAPAAPFATQMLRSLVATIDIAPRPVQPAPALASAQARLTRLLAAWDDALADELFAANFFLDEPRPRWQARLADLRTRHGALHTASAIETSNPLRGAWTMQGERGWCRIWLTLAPTAPPRVQHLSITSVFPPSAAMQAALDALLAATANPTQRAVARLFAAASDRAAQLRQLRLVNLMYGACTLDTIVGGDGAQQTLARLHSANGPLEVEVTLHPRTNKLTSAEFRTVG